MHVCMNNLQRSWKEKQEEQEEKQEKQEEKKMEVPPYYNMVYHAMLHSHEYAR